MLLALIIGVVSFHPLYSWAEPGDAAEPAAAVEPAASEADAEERPSLWISQDREDGEGPLFTRFGALATNGVATAVEVGVGATSLYLWRRQRDTYLTPERAADIRRGAGVSPGARVGLLEQEARAIVERAEERRGARGPVRSLINGIRHKTLRRTQWYAEPRAPIGGKIELHLNDTQIVKVVPATVELPDYMKAALRNLSEAEVKAYIAAVNSSANTNSALPFTLSKYIPETFADGQAHAYMRGVEQALLGESPSSDINRLGKNNPKRLAYEAGRNTILDENGRMRMTRFQIRLKHRLERVAVNHIPETVAYADEIMRSVEGRAWAGYAGPRRPWFSSHPRGKLFGWAKGSALIILPLAHATFDGYTVWATRRGVGRDALGNFTEDGAFTEYEGDNGVIFSDRTMIKNSTAGLIERFLSSDPEEDKGSTAE